MDSATDIHDLWTLQKKICDTYGHRKCVKLNNSKLPIIFNSFKNVFHLGCRLFHRTIIIFGGWGSEAEIRLIDF